MTYPTAKKVWQTPQLTIDRVADITQDGCLQLASDGPRNANSPLCPS